MALTQSRGVLGQVQQQGQQATNNVAALAREVMRRQTVAAPAPAPTYSRPVLQQVQQQAQRSIPSASAAQQIINRAVAQRSAPQQNVLQQAGQRALQTALTVAGSPAAQTFQPRDIRVSVNRQAAPPRAILTPQQESQLFDQQMQVTKQQADPLAWMDPVYAARTENQMAAIDLMRTGFQTARPNPRLQQESQALAAWPQMTPRDLRTTSDDQLAALLDLSRQPTATGAGTADATTGTPPPGEMTKGQPATWEFSNTRGPSQFYGNTTVGYGPMGWANGQPNRSGTMQVADAMDTVLQGNRAPDGGGGFFGTLMGMGGGAVDAVGEGIGDLFDELKAAASSTYEAFIGSPVGQKVAEVMELLDAGRVMNAGNYGQMFTQWANGETIAWMPGGGANPLNQTAAIPVILIGEALEEVDPTIKDQIRDVSENGYSSPQYIERLESAGVDPSTVGPQFTGDRAVWEYLISKSDDWPTAAKYPFRMVTDVLIDPLTYVPIAGQAGKQLSAAGKALGLADNAGPIKQGVGTLMSAGGRGLELAAKAPDALIEVPLRGAKAVGAFTGEMTGLLSPSTKTSRMAAAETMAAADEAIMAGRESVPAGSARHAFDAETQGVTPTSGPELIDVPTAAVADAPPVSGAVDGPTVVAREGGDTTTTPRTGTATMDPPTATITSPSTGNTYPTFESLPSVPRRGAASPSKVYDYNGTPVIIRQGTGADGVPYFSAQVRGATSVRDAVTADSYVGLMDELPKTLGGSHPTISTTPSSGPTLADVNRQINELRTNPPTGMTSREVVAEMQRLKTLRNDMRAGRVPSDGTAPPAPKTGKGTPPATPVEKQAAAAANAVPNRPRNTAEAAVNRAAAASKGTKIPTLRNASATPNVNKALTRAKRLAKEDAENLPKKVNEILRPQTRGEHEFSPIYGGNRPLDKIVTDAIDSKDAAKLKAAEALVKQVDESVEVNLRTDPFYQTWANGGNPVYLADDVRYGDGFFEAFRVFEPDADITRLRVLASGSAKGTLDDIGMLGFQVNHLFPMIAKQFPEYLNDLAGLLGTVGRIESKNFREESAEWLVREYLDTPHAPTADVILKKFLTGETELPVIADGIHKPYAHSIVADYHAESIARLAQMREQWGKIKQRAALDSKGGDGLGTPGTLDEVSDAPFREPDVAAQFSGSAKGQGRSIGARLNAAKNEIKKPTPATVEAAIGAIQDPELRTILLKGDGKLTVELAEFGDRMLPETWSPVGYSGFPVVGSRKTQWNVKEGLDWIREYAAEHPEFDYLKARNELGEIAAGLQPKRTAQEVKSMRLAAKAAGLDPKSIVDGTSRIERAAAWKIVRAFDAFMTQLRSVRMFNIITGTPGRIGDIMGNMVTHGVAGRDPLSAIKQLPLTFTNTHSYRKAARDTDTLVSNWAQSTPHMAETGSTYTGRTFQGSTKLTEEEIAKLPALNERLKNTPAGVRALANIWTVPYLKDTTLAGELIGRKMAFDRVYTHSLQHEGLQSFLAELKRVYPDTHKQVYQDILKSAQEKGGKRWSGLFSYDDVRKATDEQTARFWQARINDAIVKGDAEADRLFFANRMTNADEIARRTFTFHYWMVRASALYARSFLQNPAMLSGVYRMYTELEQQAEQNNLPGWLGGMFKFYRTGGGMYGAFDPIGILFPTIFMDAYSQEGNKFQALQNLLAPPIGGALGALGLTQNIPDATGTRTIERFIIDMGNFLKGEGVDLSQIPGFGRFIDPDSLTLKVPTEEFTKLLIDTANEAFGKPLGDFTPFDRAANEQDQLRSIALHIGQGLWGEDPNTWTPAQHEQLDAAIHQAMTGDGEETWLSETIRAQYGQEGFIRAGASFFVPGGVVTRQENRDADIEASREYWDAFYAGKPTTKEGERAAATRSLATSAQPLWVAMNNEYYEIGTKEQQKQYGAYNDLLHNPEELNHATTIVVDNGNGTFTMFTAGELSRMSWDDRYKVLDAWAANTSGMAEAIKVVGDGRKAFKEQHPDYASYGEYQKGVYGYQGGISQFRKDMADHPQFAAAMETQRKELIKQGKTGAVLEAELDNWATGQQAFFAMMGKDWKLTDDLPGGTPGPSSVMAMDRIRPDEDDESSSGSTSGTTVKDPNVDDYWGPEKGVARLAQDQAQYEHDNAEMERRFGNAWNAAEGDWEDDYDSAKERDEAGIGDKPYVTPSVTETMRRYEAWAEENPGGTPEEFFEVMLQTEGFGRKVGAAAAPTTKLPPGGTTYTPGTRTRVVPRVTAAANGTASPVRPGSTASKTGKRTMFGGKAFPLSQEYGMTGFAATQLGPGGMYDYTSGYTKDGSHVGHMGVDIATPLGTPLYAPVSGTVVQAGGVPWEQDDRYGDQPGTGGLRIELPNGDIVVMGHMQQITVQVGDSVTAGQPVGYSGTAGADPRDPGSGAHVHVEYRQYAPGQTRDGYLAIDPRTKLDL